MFCNAFYIMLIHKDLMKTWLLDFPVLRKLLDFNVLIPYFTGLALVYLQSYVSVLIYRAYALKRLFGKWLDVVGGFRSVQPYAHAGAFAPYYILVPTVRLVSGGLSELHTEEVPAALLIIQCSGFP